MFEDGQVVSCNYVHVVVQESEMKNEVGVERLVYSEKGAGAQ